MLNLISYNCHVPRISFSRMVAKVTRMTPVITSFCSPEKQAVSTTKVSQPKKQRRIMQTVFPSGTIYKNTDWAL